MLEAIDRRVLRRLQVLALRVEMRGECNVRSVRCWEQIEATGAGLSALGTCCAHCASGSSPAALA